MSIPTMSRLPAITVLALALACATPGEGVREPPNGAPHRDAATGPVVVYVQNQNTAQATLYMIEDDGMPRRIGEVPALSERFFQREIWGIRNVRFEIRILAGRTFRTPSVAASPGDTIQVTIPVRR
jgi:hypothetical protein